MKALQPEEEKNHRFLNLFTANESSIHAYVRRLVYRREDASDVMQKIAIILWKKFDQLQSDDNSSFTSPTDRITFTGITAIGADFQSVAGAITDTHWRLNYTVSGTNPSFNIHATVGIE